MNYLYEEICEMSIATMNKAFVHRDLDKLVYTKYVIIKASQKCHRLVVLLTYKRRLSNAIEQGSTSSLTTQRSTKYKTFLEIEIGFLPFLS